MMPICFSETPVSSNSNTIYITMSTSPKLYFDSVIYYSTYTASYINEPAVSIKSNGFLTSNSVVDSC